MPDDWTAEATAAWADHFGTRFNEAAVSNGHKGAPASPAGLVTLPV